MVSGFVARAQTLLRSVFIVSFADFNEVYSQGAVDTDLDTIKDMLSSSEREVAKRG
jgi:hypothetical protein